MEGARNRCESQTDKVEGRYGVEVGDTDSDKNKAVRDETDGMVREDYTEGQVGLSTVIVI